MQHALPSRPRTALAVLASAALVLAFAAGCWDSPGEPAEVQVLAGEASSQELRSRRALVVGINAYRPPEVTLRGAVNDAYAMASILEQRFGFESVRTLLNEEATHEGILAAFHEQLVLPATEGSELVFFFSGHGSSLPDPKGLDEGGSDSTLVAFDSRGAGKEPGSLDVTDDELYSLAAAAMERGARVTLIVDACHSGSGLRGESLDVRFAKAPQSVVDRSPARAHWPEDVPFLDDGDQPGAGAGLVFLAACELDQTASESRYESTGERFGSFTCHLLTSLRKAEPTWSYADLHQNVRHRMRARGLLQQPRAFGALERMLFDGRFPAVPAGYPARAMADGSLEIEGGFTGGVRAGWMLEVLDLNDGVVGEALVEEAGLRSGIAVSPDAQAPWKKGDSLRVRPVRMPSEQAPLRVRVSDPSLREWLAGAHMVEVVEPPGEARLALSLAGERAELVTEEGIVLWAGADRRGLEQALLRALQRRGLLELCEAGGPLELSLELESPRTDELADIEAVPAAFVPGGAGAIEAEGRDAERPVSAENPHRAVVLVGRHTSSTPLHLTLVSVSESGELNPEYGSSAGVSPLARPGEAVRFVVGLLRPDPRRWPLKRPMGERYVLIGTRSPIRPETWGSLQRGVSDHAVPPRVARMLFGRSRGRDVVLDDEGWGCAWLDVWIEPAR